MSRDSTLGACTRATLDRALRKTLFPRDGSPCAAALCLPGEGITKCITNDYRLY